ncbi:MAG TPA: alpha/beta hydrolase [Candidatus Limnocylindrales bacterium]|nr:alpha/beta hydrolase [Candidatus Limnocylindrales bacterium]
MRIAVDDVEIEVDCQGEAVSGPAVVLVHGLGGSRRTWSALMPLLARHVKVVAPDLRGCGDSSRGSAAYTLARAADDVARVAEAVGLERYVAVGHSLGGVLVEELLTRQIPAIAGAVLISTSSRLSEKATQNWRRIADSVEANGISPSPAARARGFTEEFAREHADVLDFHAAIAARTDRRVYAEQARAASSYDYTDALARVTCPVLILQGLADQMTPPGGSVLLQRAMPSVARLEMIEGGDHNLPLERPELVAEKILGFARDVFAEPR